MKNKKLAILGTLIIGIFVILIARITFAYLSPIINEAFTNVLVKSDTVDNLKFELGSPLKLNATPTTLPENGDNYTSITTATAKLKANSTNKTATYKYNVYFQIVTNNFVYIDNSTPEIILTITNPDGEILTELEGLKYGTYNGVSGFDVTTEVGFYTISVNHEIASTSSSAYKNQTWTFSLTYLNNSFDQSANFGKNMITNILMKKEALDEIAIDNITSESSATSIAIEINESSKTQNITKYYYSLDNGKTYKESENKNIKFDDLTPKTIYKAKIYGIDEYQRKTNVYSVNLSTYFLSDYIKDQYTGSGTLLLHDSNLNNSANDNSYRYSGGDYILTSKAKNVGYTTVGNSKPDGVNALIHFYCDGERQYLGYSCTTETYDDDFYTLDYDESIKYESLQEALDKSVEDGYLLSDNIKNFVCFGSNETPCPDENLYRIIGVFDDTVKLIKWTYVEDKMIGREYNLGNYNNKYYYSYLRKPTFVNKYYWDKTGETNWTTSSTNTNGLNNNYLNYLGTSWNNKIKISDWQIGGNNRDVLNLTAHEVYQNEIVNSAENKIYQAKIGLMYISDYAFAMKPDGWVYSITDVYGSRYYIYDNWLYDHGFSWVITKDTNTGKAIAIKGFAPLIEVSNSSGGIKPVFYLKSNITYISGTGTEKDPYRMQ